MRIIMANCKFLVAGIIIFLATLHVALSENIECYQCVIDGEGPCRNALKDSNLTVSCPHSCITHTFSIGGKSSKEKVVRVCAPPDYCGVGIKLLETQGGIKTQGCELCNTNLCNAPPPATTVTTDDEPRALSENIECYQCVTEGEGACRNMQNDRNLTVSCPHSCITHTMAPLAIGRGNSGEMVARVCSTTDYCEIGTEMLETQLGLKTRGCVSCNTNLCNAPPTTTTAVTTATESRALSENIECYYCVSDGKGPCRNPQNEKNLTVSCPHSCITHTIAPLSIRSTSSGEIVTRVCAAPDYCEIGTKLLETHAGLKTLGCVVCNTNLCNAPPTTTTVTTDIESKALSENIECYQCLNDCEGPCKNVQNDKNLTVSCPHSCITHTMAPLSIGRGNSGEIIARVCSTPDYCEVGTQFLETQLGLKTRGCVSCNTNLCNAPPTTTAAETTDTESRALSENIECYQCVKDGEGPCKNVQNDKNLTVSCPHSCITHTMAPLSIGRSNSGEIIARVCSTPDYCEVGTKFLETQLGLKTRGCVSCNTNLCNAPPTTTAAETRNTESRALSENIECYQCVKDGEGPCKNVQNDKNLTVSCPHSCITHTMAPLSIGRSNSGEIIARVCSTPDYCEVGTKFLETQLGLKTRGCVSCNTNLCNAPPTTTAAETTDTESRALSENIKCYQCVQDGEGPCTNAQKDNNLTVSCQHSCITHTVALSIRGMSSKEIVTRVCATSDYCEIGTKLLETQAGLKTLGCVACNTNLCNAPPTTTTVTTDIESRAVPGNIECYQCVNDGEGPCKNALNDKNIIVNCPHSCITHTLDPLSIGGRISSAEIVARVCSSPDYCEMGTKILETQLGLKTGGCVACNTNRCNAPRTTTAAITTDIESTAATENIECYVCVSENGKQCRDTHNNINPTSNCPHSCITHTVARITSGATNSEGMVIRLCSSPDFCKVGAALLERHMDFKTLGCVSCNSSLCNAPSPTISP